MKQVTMPESLKIIIFDGSFKTTPFVNRLLKGLVENQEVFVLGFNEELLQPVDEVKYISLGSNQSKIKFIGTSLLICIKAKKVQLLLRTIYKLLSGKRNELQQQNLKLSIKHINPDIIHLQWPSAIPLFEEVLNEQKTPVILSQRGYHSNVRPFVDAKNFKCLKKWYPKIAGFHSVSKAIANKGDEIYTSAEKINKVVYTGVNSMEIPYAKTYTSSKILEIISIGRPHWIKGYEYALQSCKLLKDKGVNFTYTIIGGKDDEELQYLCHDLGIQNEVQLLGRRSQKEVFEYMHKSSVLVLPSLAEGVPNVVVEAMALGVPVISTACGGVEELITNDMNGWLVATRSPKELAEALMKFSKFPLETIEEIRIAARIKVEQQHSESLMVSGMEGLYNDIITSKIK